MACSDSKHAQKITKVIKCLGMSDGFGTWKVNDIERGFTFRMDIT